jgi:hypothetical protein
VRLPLLSWSKTFQVPGQVRERTGPALIHNQLVDRSLQTNVCHESSCYKCRNSSGSLPRSFPCNTFPLQFRILPSKIRDRAPLLDAVVGHAQFERLHSCFAFGREFTAQFRSMAARARLGQKEAGS